MRRRPPASPDPPGISGQQLNALTAAVTGAVTDALQRSALIPQASPPEPASSTALVPSGSGAPSPRPSLFGARPGATPSVTSR